MAIVFKAYLTATMLLFWFVNKGKADNFGDIRCTCICDKTWNPDGKKVVIRSPIAKELCNCQNVVTPLYPTLPCPGCVCNVQTRNTRTIKAMVFIIIGAVSLLLVFMIFLTLVDPVIQRCLDICLDQEQKGDDSKTADGDSAAPPSTSTGATSTTAKKNRKLNTTQRKQKKWEGTAKEQRKNIYKHSMLN